MKNTNKKGFTLVELLIVIVVIGILFIVVVANVDFSTDAAKEAGVQSTFKSYKIAAETAALECNGFLQDEADLIKYLNKRLDSELQITIDNGNFKTSAADPWGTEFRIEKSQPINTHGQLTFTSAGPDMKFDTADDMIMAVKYIVANGRGETVTTYPEYDPDHVHNYSEKIIDDFYKKSSANCQSPAVYYYVCSCGTVGSSTFTDGEKNLNKHDEILETYVPLANNKHKLTKTCKACGTIIEELETNHSSSGDNVCPDCGGTLHEHVFTEQVQTEQFKKNDADCINPLTYYYSCACGEQGTLTFTVGSITSHNFTKETTDYFASAATCQKPAQYYYSCTGCNAKGTVTYSVGTVNNNHIGSDVTTYETLNATQHNKIVKYSVCGHEKLRVVENHSPTTGTCTLCNNHTHTWTETASAAYLASAANCQSAAKYYKSCSCGEKDISNTFTVGSPDLNVHVGNVVNGGSEDVHTKYSECGHTASTTHSYSETITVTATCQREGAKKLVCECGYEKTENITQLSHNTDGRDLTYLVSEAYCRGKAVYYKTCSMCHTKQTGTFEYGNFDTTTHKGGETITYVTLNSTHHNKIVKCDTCGGEKSKTAEPHDNNVSCTICNNHTHSFTETVKASALKSDANCISPAVYYKSCSCGMNDTSTTFTTGSKNMNVHASECKIVLVSTENKCREYSLCHTPVAGGHDYTETITQAATCLGNGTKLYDCVYCEYSYTETIIATGHTPGPVATCTTDQVCTVCGAVLDEADGHVYNREVQHADYFVSAATCQTPLTYNKSCYCGAKGNSTFTVGDVDSSNHVNKVPVYGGTADVHTKYKCCGAIASSTHSMTNVGVPSECQRCACGYVTTEHNMVNVGTEDVHQRCSNGCGYYTNAHVYTDDEKEPTCVDDGWLLKHCDCGYDYLHETYLALGHQYKETVYDWEDDCSECYAYKVCGRCDEHYDGEYSYEIEYYCYSEATNCQAYDMWEHRAYFYNYSFSRCSCTINGDKGPHNITRYGADMIQHWDYCTLCSYTEDHENHTVTSWTKTYVGDGRWKIAGSCSICGKDLTHYHSEDGTEPCPYCNETVSHDWSLQDWAYGSHCMDSGWEYYVCSICGTEYTIYDINYGDHEYSLYESTVGTCINPGYDYYRCILCGDEYVSPNSRASHDWGWIDSGTGSDCTERDWDSYICGYCNAEKIEYGDPGPHREFKLSECDATCLSKAYNIYECYNCGNQRTVEYGEIDPDEHVGSTSNTASASVCRTYSCCGATTEHNLQYRSTVTCTSSGYTQEYCMICGYTGAEMYEAARGHDWGSDADGLCEVCNASCSHGPAETYYRSVGSEGHQEVYFCGECGYEHWSSGSMAHDLISIDGYNFSCSYCGYGVRVPGGGGGTVL